MIIAPDIPLRELAFEVCTALEISGTTAVLTGGSAATVYAPHAYQSRDLDFVIQFQAADSQPGAALRSLGFQLRGQEYIHPATDYSLDFPKGPLQVGGDYLDAFDTMRDGSRLLHILSPTDCCRDRLAGLIHWKDRSSLDQALAVAQAHPTRIDLDRIRTWMKREGGHGEWQEFARLL